jgi:teichuronic acid biosynthesis glycosyltransferase TuaG
MTLTDNADGKSPLVSIIIPTYNSYKFIAEAINSVLSQTYSKWELHIIDDGSTDETKTLVLKYTKKDLRIKYYYQSNKGQAAARNTGILNSTGLFIAFLDSDDIWMDNKLELQLKIQMQYDADFVFSAAQHFSETSTITSLAFHQKGILHGSSFFIDLFQRCPISNSSVLLKRDILNKTGLLDESVQLKGTEDWDLWLRIAKHDYKFYGIETKLIKYRIHENGTHLNIIKMLKGKLAIQDKYRFDKEIPRWVKIKKYRSVYRELINQYQESKTSLATEELLDDLKIRDVNGLCTSMQIILFKLVSPKAFIFLSNKVLYRIFYRTESINYFISSIIRV